MIAVRVACGEKTLERTTSIGTPSLLRHPKSQPYDRCGEEALVSVEATPQRMGRIAFARISPFERPQLSLFPSNARENLIEDVRPATLIERYNRVWHMGQVNRDERFIYGRIGFEAAGDTTLWNETLQDFEEVVLPQGKTSPFAVDLDELRVAFQLRTPFIRPKTFTGAFQSLLNEAAGELRWQMQQEVTVVSWEDWRRSVSRVTAIRFTLERPNPNYAGRRRVEELIEGTNTAMLNTILRAAPEDLDGLNVDNEFVQESLEHVLVGNGSATAEGEEIEEREAHFTSWSSRQGGSPVQRPAPVNADTREVELANLIEALLELSGSEAAPSAAYQPPDRGAGQEDEISRLEDEVLEISLLEVSPEAETDQQ
jgi:hypothetical protein